MDDTRDFLVEFYPELLYIYDKTSKSLYINEPISKVVNILQLVDFFLNLIKKASTINLGEDILIILYGWGIGLISDSPSKFIIM